MTAMLGFLAGFALGALAMLAVAFLIAASDE